MDSFRQSRNQLFGLLLALVTFTGCASSYRQPSLPRNATASLRAAAPVWIVAIDGKKVSRISLSGKKQFRVSPGSHTIEVQYVQFERPYQEESGGGATYTVLGQTMSEKNILVHFFATAGTTYYVRAGRSEDLWKPVVTDTPEPVRH
jgi:hypothetical protein